MFTMYKKARFWGFFIFVIGITSLIFYWFRNPGGVKSYLYSVFRMGSRIALNLQTRQYKVLENNHFIIKYTEADSHAANLVLEVAEEIYQPVNQSLGFTPSKKVLIIIYPSSYELNRCFGWPANENALGVYWCGTIRILSPNAWSVTDNRKVDAKMFRTNGPIAHEYTHYVIDYLTKGNYPRWFTEGIAQWIEKNLTGFSFSNPFTEEDSTIYFNGGKSGKHLNLSEKIFRDLYPLNKMNRDFDYLPNQMLAYWESLMAIEYVIEEYSAESINFIIDELGQGKEINLALKQILNIDLDKFDDNFRKWAADKVAREIIEREKARNIQFNDEQVWISLEKIAVARDF